MTLILLLALCFFPIGFGQSNESAFDPITLLIRDCGLAPTAHLPKMDKLHLDTDVFLSVDRLMAIDDVGESFSIRSGIFIVWQLDCLKQLYESPKWPKEISYFDNANAQLFWSPTLLHRNSVEHLDIRKGQGVQEVYRINMTIGEIQLGYYSIFHSTCDMNFYTFPFDIQQCSVWLSTVSKVFKVQSVDGFLADEQFSVGKNFEWKLYSNTINATIDANPTGYDLRFLMYFKRRHNYFTINLLAPAVILQLLELSSFLIPPNSPDRATYAITIMLSLYVLRTEMLSYLPKTPEPIVVTFYLLGATVFAMFCALYAAAVCWLIESFPSVRQQKSFFHKRYSQIGCIEAIFFTFALLFLLILNLSCATETGLL